MPTDFWNNVRIELDAIKPVFMLAERESRDLHAEAFDMTSVWSGNENMHRIATGKGDLEQLRIHCSWNEKAYPADGMRMCLVSKHDKNSWEGTEFEQFGEALEAAIVLSVVGEGMPLIYNGQEAGNDKRLEFCERDPIVWREYPLGELYRGLFRLKRTNTALWNAHWGARMIEMRNNAQAHVLSFVRGNDKDRILAAFNLSAQPQLVTLFESLCHGGFVDHFTGEVVRVDESTRVELAPLAFRVLIRPS